MAVPVNTVAPFIIFGGFVGRTQQINTGSWTNSPTSYTYQWGRANDAIGTGATSITGATLSTYNFTEADQGKYVYCNVVARNADGDSLSTRSNYRFCYTRVELPSATTLAESFDDLGEYDGKFIINESLSDSVVEVVPDPTTWKDEEPQNTKYYGWFSVAVDTSGVVRGSGSGCTKLSENWGVVAKHVPGTGDGYYFLDDDETEHAVGYDSFVQIGDSTNPGCDMWLIHFDSPILDSDVPPIALPTAAMYNALAGRQALSIEMDRHMSLRLLSENTDEDSDTSWTNVNSDILEPGDSGKPVFLYVEGTPVLVATAHHTSVSGPNPAHWLREIQDVLASTGDSLTLVSLQNLDNETYELVRGETYEQTYGVAAADGVTIYATGTGDPPIIAGDEQVTAANWSASAHGDAGGVVYELVWPTDAATNGLGTVRMWEDGTQIDDKGSVALCAANAGSFYCPDSRGNGGSLWTGGSVLVYYHPTGSGNPTSNGKVTRLSARMGCVVLGNDAVVEGVEVRHCLQNDGPMTAGTNALIDRCIIDGDYKHGCVVKSGIIRRTVFTPGLRYSYPSELSNGMLGWYADDPSALSTLVDQCVIAGSWSAVSASQSLTQHGAALSYLSATMRGTSFMGHLSAIVGNAASVTAEGIYITRCTQSIPNGSSSGSFVCENAIINANDSAGAGAFGTISGTKTYRDMCVYMTPVSGSSSLCSISTASTSITFENCIFFTEPVAETSGRGVCQSADSTARTVTFNNCLIIGNGFDGFLNTGTNLTYAGSRNVFIRYRQNTSTAYMAGLSETTNLNVAKNSSHGYSSDANILTLLNSIFNGDCTQVVNGDFRISQAAIRAINSGNFPDGSPIADYTIGARTRWDFEANQAVGGQPTQWPDVPESYADAQDWVQELPQVSSGVLGAKITANMGLRF